MDNWLHQDKQQLSALASLVAATLSEDMTVEDIELMRSFLLSVVALLGTIAFQQRILEKKENDCKKKQEDWKQDWEKRHKQKKEANDQAETDDELIDIEDTNDNEFDNEQQTAPDHKHTHHDRYDHNRDGYNYTENKKKRD